jgi:hypothetical protein
MKMSSTILPMTDRALENYIQNIRMWDVIIYILLHALFLCSLTREDYTEEAWQAVIEVRLVQILYLIFAA